MTNSPVISVHDATIRTATIEIKSLTVNGRQVTQALFRQLHEELMLIDTGTPRLLGPVWGYVNHCSPYCKRLNRYGVGHKHFIWQKGEELRQCRLDFVSTYDSSDTPTITMFVPVHEDAEAYIDTKGEWGSFPQEWATLQQLLKDAPQLFIAV